MANDSLCRHAVQFVVNGHTLIDGVMAAAAIDHAVNGFLREMEAPPMYLGILSKARKGYHYAADISINGGIAMLEITTLADAQGGGRETRITHEPK